MDAQQMTAALERSGRATVALYRGLPVEEAARRPARGKWSLLEILAHLADEERDDFRTRVRSTLEDPTAPWPSIDPEGWVTERRYSERDLVETLADFEAERAASLAWLAGLHDADWSTTHHHPALGSLSAGDVFASWVAHDLGHLRQIVNTRLTLLAADAAPFDTAYAGVS